MITRRIRITKPIFMFKNFCWKKQESKLSTQILPVKMLVGCAKIDTNIITSLIKVRLFWWTCYYLDQTIPYNKYKLTEKECESSELIRKKANQVVYDTINELKSYLYNTVNN